MRINLYADGFNGVPCAKLAHQIGAMNLHGAGTDLQGAANFLIPMIAVDDSRGGIPIRWLT